MLTAAQLADMVATFKQVEKLGINPTPEQIGYLNAKAIGHIIVLNVYALDQIKVPVDLTVAAPVQQEAAQ